MISLLAGVALAGAGGDAPWRLVGAWDLAAVRAAAGEDLAQTDWIWSPSAGMSGSCGPAKAPDGLGSFEAEALATGLGSALVVLLRAEGEAPTPGPETLRIALGTGEPQIALEPMVEPRHLAITVLGDAERRPVQLARTQLAMELCLEHKVGRSWTGRDAASLRQAFLLDPPDNGRADRKFFGGQRDPVPALLGPPDACVQGGAAEPAAGGRGEGSLDLVPSDLWGAALRPCGEAEAPGLVAEDRRVPLRLAVEDPGRPAPRWSGLELRVTTPEEDSETTVDLSLDGRALLTGAPLFADGGEGAHLTDLVAALPRAYPSLGFPGDLQRYTALIVPAWQLEEALARLDAGDPRQPRPRASETAQTAVARVLSHPELLFVQTLERGGDRWLNLTEGMGRGGLDLRSWGYQAGLRAASEPILRLGGGAPGTAELQRAQRAVEQAIFLLCAAVVGVLGALGLRRLADLWTAVPQERADYWPGRNGPVPEAGADGPSSPQAEFVPEGS